MKLLTFDIEEYYKELTNKSDSDEITPENLDLDNIEGWDE